MEVLPIQTPILKEGDDLAAILFENADIQDGDIIAISSKAVATVEGAAKKLDDVTASREAELLSDTHGKSAAYYEMVIKESERMNGRVIQSVNGIVLTELHPHDDPEGTILVPNSGLDKSNVEDGFVIGWPEDPVKSLGVLRSMLRNMLRNNGSDDVALLLTDSGLTPRRQGVTSFALTVSGFDPLESLIGTPDLFGHDMRVTQEAVADQLATAANFVMGNSNQSIPAAIIRDHGLEFTDFEGWVPGIEREKDIYHGVI